ncbi:MAG TPA: LuxR C-terminal-related transcriptional regulator [Candidatus Dormibacteraeota bacterium]
MGTSVMRLPARSTSFVGRTAELDAICGLLGSSRLVTIAGTAGMGKTRLAIEVASRLGGDVRFVGLAALDDGGLVPNEVAARLGVAERVGVPVLDVLADHVGTRPLLLLLDNCEHLVDDCALLVEALLRGCDDLRVLATSLQPLRVPGEVVWRLAPLTGEAVGLFEARARRVRPDFAVAPDNAEAVAAVCRLLDGIPLAIELAAARMGRMSVADILERLDDRFHVLADDGADEPRHRTLRAALDWGHQLLDEQERGLLRRLSVFAGTFDLETAEGVCAGAGLAPGDVSELVFHLVERSLVQAETGRRGPDRYRLLEPVRRYAAERLAQSGEQPVVAERHAACCLALARRAEREERGQDQTGWLRRLEMELDNLRAALAWYRGHDVDAWLALASALSWFWVTHGHYAEGRAWLEGALAAASPDAPGRGRALLAAARVAFYQGDYPAARRLCEAALDRFRLPADAGDRGWTLGLLGSVHAYQAEYAEGAARFQEAIAASDDDLVQMEALVGLGEMWLQAGDVERARVSLDEVSRRTRGPDAPRGRAALFLGLAALFAGNRAAAADELAWSLEIFHRLGNRYGAAGSLDALAGLAVANDDPVRALRLSGAAAAMRDSIRSQLAPRWREIVREAVLDPARAAAGDQADVAWAAGLEMTFDGAARYAMSGLLGMASPRRRAGRGARPRQPGGLTARELEIAELVAEGMTNRKISEHLVIAERTVEGHVERIRNKLGVHSRTQIGAALARQRAWPSA